MTKKKYLAFLIFSLILTLVLSGLLITKILKNEASKDIKYIKTTINSTPNTNESTANIKTTNIRIHNIQNEEPSINISYEYKIIIEGIKGIKKYNYNGEEKYLRFNENNEATITLNSNEEITILDIPIDLNYSVEQSINKKYQVVNNNTSNSLFEGTTTNENNIEFKNTSSVVKVNPMTNSKIIILFIVDFIIIISLISLRKIKIKKYETID